MQNHPEKFLLCRPESGLNDMLCQIGKCAVYAQMHQRILVIGTRMTGFQEPFWQYFESLNPRIVFASPALLDHLNTLDVYPPFLMGRLKNSRPQYSVAHRNFVFANTGAPLSFDFGRVYAESLLVHHAHGGGLQSLEALKHLRLRGELIEKLHARLSVAGEHYAGIHVRHTDYQSDYKPFLNSLVDKITQPHVVLCTDNKEVLDYARGIFRQPLHNFSAIPDIGGRPLHHGNPANKQQINTDAILDLFTLAKASTLFLTPISNASRYNNHSGYSGYSRLAGALNQNPALVNALLGARPASGEIRSSAV